MEDLRDQQQRLEAERYSQQLLEAGGRQQHLEAGGNDQHILEREIYEM